MGLHFLRKIAHVDVLYYMLRAFDHDDVTHYYESIDAVSELQMIQQELMLYVCMRVLSYSNTCVMAYTHE